ncbi:PucR family transcriptional regulator, partial [Pseudomonas sp. BGM005]|nr:PucR family transcriptional regulator [Pseudomonas sp. BG5]
LWSYLDNGRSLEATARELFVHPNTVRYRLKRVSEVIGWDATGPREALILQTSLILGSIGAADQVRRRPPLRRTPR